MNPPSASPPAVGVRPEAGAPLMGPDLCVLTAHLLMHILAIDRSHAQRRGCSVETQVAGVEPKRMKHE